MLFKIFRPTVRKNGTVRKKMTLLWQNQISSLTHGFASPNTPWLPKQMSDRLHDWRKSYDQFCPPNLTEKWSNFCNLWIKTVNPERWIPKSVCLPHIEVVRLNRPCEIEWRKLEIRRMLRNWDIKSQTFQKNSQFNFNA